MEVKNYVITCRCFLKSNASAFQKIKNYPGTETKFLLMLIWFFKWNQLGFLGHSKAATWDAL